MMKTFLTYVVENTLVAYCAG